VTTNKANLAIAISLTVLDGRIGVYCGQSVWTGARGLLANVWERAIAGMGGSLRFQRKAGNLIAACAPIGSRGERNV